VVRRSICPRCLPSIAPRVRCWSRGIAAGWYCGRSHADNVNELYSVPITGDAPTKLSGTTSAAANVSSSFLISANSSRVVFPADRDVDGVLELYSNSLDGTTGLIKLTGVLPGTTGVTSFRVTPHGARVVYRASNDTAGLSEIYSAPATAVGASIKLSSTTIGGGNTTGQLELAPNGQRVVPLVNKDSTTLLDLYSAPVAQSRRPSRLRLPRRPIAHLASTSHPIRAACCAGIPATAQTSPTCSVLLSAQVRLACRSRLKSICAG